MIALKINNFYHRIYVFSLLYLNRLHVDVIYKTACAYENWNVNNVTEYDTKII